MSKKQKVVAFTIADQNNMKFAMQLKNSLRKFHSEEELPLILVGPDQINAQNDPHFFYRATPVVALDLLKDYDTVIKLDADQIITGDLSHVWKDDYDIGVVQNSNPRESKSYSVKVWNIDPMAYVNCGFVAMKNKRMVEHWRNLCFSPHFNSYQYREQDLLNIMVFYGDYRTLFLDSESKWHGLISKQYEPYMELRDGKLVLPKNDEWPASEDKEIVCVHFAGGNNPNKGNYRTMFSDEVVKHIEELISDGEKEKTK